MTRSNLSLPFLALLLALLLLSPATGQTPQTPNGGTGSGSQLPNSGTSPTSLPAASATPLAGNTTTTLPPATNTATPTNATTATNTTTPSTTPNLSTLPCGTSPGQFVIDRPVASFQALVGTPLNITWHYSALTNTSTYPISSITLYYQNADSDILPTNWKLATTLPRSQTTYNWTVPQLADGNYMIRIVADDWDAQQRQGICYPDGFPTASSSQRFRINNNIPLPTYKDGMGASSGAALPFRLSTEGAAALVLTGLAGVFAALVGVLL
ncbi:hypothetical protein HDV00_002136 [Rhizophlyctis rosea]|nr:hypothetical protein HDV00_002136 [Rhizophlyctis rosea]